MNKEKYIYLENDDEIDPQKDIITLGFSSGLFEEMEQFSEEASFKVSEEQSLYQSAKACLNRQEYEKAKDVFKSLAMKRYKDSDKLYSCAMAGAECKNGYLGRACHIYKSLKGYKGTDILAKIIEDRLSIYNGIYKTDDTFLSNYLFVQNGEIALESTYLFNGSPTYMYDLQFINNKIFAKLSMDIGAGQTKLYTLIFNGDCSGVQVTAPEHASDSFTGVYRRTEL